MIFLPFKFYNFVSFSYPAKVVAPGLAVVAAVGCCLGSVAGQFAPNVVVATCLYGPAVVPAGQ